MRYLVREKLISLGDDFKITDEQGNLRYIADGKALTIRDATSLRTAKGEEVCRLHRKLLSIGTTYEIVRNGKTTTVHRHLFTLFKAKFTVDVPGPGDLEATGSFLDHEYTFRDERGRKVAEVSKKWLTLRDTYAVDVEEGADDVLILAATVVIDLCCHGDKE